MNKWADDRRRKPWLAAILPGLIRNILSIACPRGTRRANGYGLPKLSGEEGVQDSWIHMVQLITRKDREGLIITRDHRAGAAIKSRRLGWDGQQFISHSFPRDALNRQRYQESLPSGNRATETLCSLRDHKPVFWGMFIMKPFPCSRHCAKHFAITPWALLTVPDEKSAHMVEIKDSGAAGLELSSAPC